MMDPLLSRRIEVLCREASARSSKEEIFPLHPSVGVVLWEGSLGAKLGVGSSSINVGVSSVEMAGIFPTGCVTGCTETGAECADTAEIILA